MITYFSRVLATILFFLTAAACAPVQNGAAPPEGEEADGEGKSLEEMRAEALAEIDVDACDAGGGEVRPEGMLGLPRCVTLYADAGERCRGPEDCEGRCLGDDSVTDYDASPGEMFGLCEADDSPFGCFAVIDNGSTEGMICVD